MMITATASSSSLLQRAKDNRALSNTTNLFKSVSKGLITFSGFWAFLLSSNVEDEQMLCLVSGIVALGTLSYTAYTRYMNTKVLDKTLMAIKTHVFVEKKKYTLLSWQVKLARSAFWFAAISSIFDFISTSKGWLDFTDFLFHSSKCLHAWTCSGNFLLSALLGLCSVWQFGLYRVAPVENGWKVLFESIAHRSTQEYFWAKMFLLAMSVAGYLVQNLWFTQTGLKKFITASVLAFHPGSLYKIGEGSTADLACYAVGILFTFFGFFVTVGNGTDIFKLNAEYFRTLAQFIRMNRVKFVLLGAMALLDMFGLSSFAFDGFSTSFHMNVIPVPARPTALDLTKFMTLMIVVVCMDIPYFVFNLFRAGRMEDLEVGAVKSLKRMLAEKITREEGAITAVRLLPEKSIIDKKTTASWQVELVLNADSPAYSEIQQKIEKLKQPMSLPKVDEMREDITQPLLPPTDGVAVSVPDHIIRIPGLQFFWEALKAEESLPVAPSPVADRAQKSTCWSGLFAYFNRSSTKEISRGINPVSQDNGSVFYSGSVRRAVA